MLQYFIQIITIIEWQPVRSLLVNAHREREGKTEKTLIYECGKDNMLSAKRMAKSWRCRSFSKTSWRALTKKQVRSVCQMDGSWHSWLSFSCAYLQRLGIVFRISFNPNHRKSYQVNDFYASIWDLWGLQAYRWISASLRGQITNGPIFFFGRSWKVQTRTLSSSWRTWWRPLGAQEPWSEVFLSSLGSSGSVMQDVYEILWAAQNHLNSGNCPVDLQILDDLGGFGSVFVLFSGCHSVLEQRAR